MNSKQKFGKPPSKPLLPTQLKNKLKNYSLKLVGQSPKIEAIVRPRLERYLSNISVDINPQLIDEVIDFLHQLNLLNEEKYVESFIRVHPKYSPKKIIYLLSHYKISPNVINQHLPNELEIVAKIIQKKYSAIDLKNYQYRQKISLSLLRKGFAIDSIKKSIDSIVKSG